MRIQKRVRLVLGTITLAVTLFVTGTVWGFSLYSIRTLEEEQLYQSLQTAQAAFKHDLANLEGLARDWSESDELYAFAGGENPQYVKDNLKGETMENLRLSMMALVSPSGQVIYSQAYNFNSEKFVPVSREMLDELLAQPKIWKYSTYQFHFSGIILLNETPVMVSTWPILRDSFRGPARGALIFCRQLNGIESTYLSEQTGRQVWFESLKNTDIPKRDIFGRFNELGKKNVLTSIPNPETMRSSVLIEGLDGEPVAILVVETSRLTYLQGIQNLALFTFVLLGLVVLLLVVNTFYLDRAVLSRIRSLGIQISQIGCHADPSLRVELPGNDELTSLAKDINSTLEALEASNSALNASQDRLVHETLHDSLTGLPNRGYFFKQVSRALDRQRIIQNYYSAVLYIDLDRFKIINESLGHVIGDQVLVIIARRLLGCLRPGDTISRIGGDEFAVLLEEVGNVDEAVHTAQNIHRQISEPFNLSGHEMSLTASMGLAFTDRLPSQAEDLLRDAHTAMYQAKAEGRSKIQVFNAHMHEHIVAILKLETELKQALEHHQFEVHYQPIVSLPSMRVEKVEALVRWRHPKQGLLLPETFINLAEETGVILSIGEQVLRTACRQVCKWRKSGREIKVSVNISARQLYEPNFSDLIPAVLQECAQCGSLLELEITENTAMWDASRAADILHGLRQMGVNIIIDDFGTSYSSLAYLKSFPVSGIKIDRIFIRDIPENRDAVSIVTAMIAMAKALRLRTVVEGVENLNQLDFLLTTDCDAAQGFLFAPALPAGKATDWLNEKKKFPFTG